MGFHRYRITLKSEISHKEKKWEWVAKAELPMVRRRLERALPRIKAAVRASGLRFDDLSVEKVEPVVKATRRRTSPKRR